jgi:serine/threonine protein kinase
VCFDVFLWFLGFGVLSHIASFMRFMFCKSILFLCDCRTVAAALLLQLERLYIYIIAMLKVPHFWEDEIECGKLLGSGSYCRVLKVEDIVLLPSADGGEEAAQTLELQRQRLAHRFENARGRGKPTKQEIADLAIYGKSTKPPKEIDDPEAEPAPKLALKRLRDDNKLSSGQLQTAREDFQRELEILLEVVSPLTSLDIRGETSSTAPFHHANVIELYGVGFDSTNSDDPKGRPSCPLNMDLKPSFLLLGQIRATLTKRLVKWRDEKGSGIYEALSLDTTNRRNQWIERLLVISKVAHAIEHLHKHQILYRDIKPDNIGYDALDVPKIFDFGLAKKISNEMRFRKSNKNSEEDPLDEGLFYLTAETGTLLYMSIENGKGRPYGWSADVYSLAILMHEVLSLKVPFGGIAARQFRQVVWNEGRGLVVDSSWPDPIQVLLPQMWHSDPSERPAISKVVVVLDDMLRGSERNLFPRNMLSSGRFAFLRMS